MPPLTQDQLASTLAAFFGWADFSCTNMPKVQSYFCHDPVPGLSFEGTISMAKQSFKHEADINNIVKQYLKTGVLPEGSRQPTYGDFSSGDDYAECLIKIQNAQDDFDALPSDLRERFENDPENFLSFMSDENNREEAEKMGLIPPQSKANNEPGQGAEEPPETKEPEA